MGWVPNLILTLFSGRARRSQDAKSSELGYIIRLDQPWPEGIGASLINKVGPYRDGIPVAGVSKEPAKQHFIALIKGERQSIELLRDPSNKYDQDAVRVIGHWYDAKGSHYQGQIGWVPANIAKEIADCYPTGPIGGRIMVMYLPRPGKDAGIRIDIGRPSLRRKK